MRALFVVLVACALVGCAAETVGDADDAALMELGIDLAHRVDPTPTYTTTRPDGHEDTTIAKFPMLHEIKGLEAKDWGDIQSLLFREPPSAAESNVDMKLDELEEKFNKLDTMPVPSSVAPAGSTLLPSLIKPELGLRATLPAGMPRLQQVAAKPQQAATKSLKAKVRAAAPTTPAPAVAKAPAAAPAKAAPVAAAKAAPAAAAPAAKAAAAAPAKAATVDEIKAREAAKAKSTERVRNTVTTVRLIEKRLKGLTSLVQRLKSQIGLKAEETQSSASRLTAALAKHRKDKADLAKRLANRKTRFAQVGLDEEADAAEHSLAETESATEGESETEAHSDVAAAMESESEVDAESEAQAEAELTADAEAVDEILDQLL